MNQQASWIYNAELHKKQKLQKKQSLQLAMKKKKAWTLNTLCLLLSSEDFTNLTAKCTKYFTYLDEWPVLLQNCYYIFAFGQPFIEIGVDVQVFLTTGHSTDITTKYYTENIISSCEITRYFKCRILIIRGIVQNFTIRLNKDITNDLLHCQRTWHFSTYTVI